MKAKTSGQRGSFLHRFAIALAGVMALTGSGSLPAMAQCDPPPAGVVGWWRAENNANDSAGANGGVLFGNATYAAGKVGQAFSFDGNGDAVLLGNPAAFQMQNFTIETWIKRGDTNNATLTGAGGNLFCYGNNGYGLVILNNGTPSLSLVGVSGVFGTVAITDLAFHHLAVTKNGTNVVFYVDGVASPATYYAAVFSFTTSAAIGAKGDDFSGSFLGLIDEMSLYSRALAASEIQAIYNAGSTGKCTAALPTISIEPTNVTVAQGSNTSFTVVAGGTPPLSYVWSFSAGGLSAATNSTLPINNAQATNVGNYQVIITNTYGAVTSAVVKLTLQSPPSITQAPSNQLVLPNSTVVFTVAASGSPPLHYQWCLNTTNLTGQTDYLLELPNVQVTNGGSYTVVVTNSYGSVTSTPPAILFVSVPPTITNQPVGQTNYLGGNVLFSVGATSFTNVFYQWQLGGTNLAGATNAALPLNNLQATNAGTYSVLVSNVAGVTPSSNAVLVLNAPVCAAAPAGLVRWWEGENSSADVVTGAAGTLIGNTTYAPGKVGQAFSFDGSGDAVSVGNPAALQLQDFTVEAWVQRSNTNLTTLSGAGSGVIFGYGTLGYLVGLLNDGTPFLSKADASNVQGGRKINDTAFHHLAVTKSGTNVVIYVDGAATLTTNYSVTFTFGTSAAIGARGDNSSGSFLGSVDEVSVYNRALSAAEVQAIYSSTVIGKCAMPISFASQPTNQSLFVGSNVTFNVNAASTSPITFQWFQNGAAISGATNAALTLSGVSFFQAGSYTLMASNAFGPTNISAFFLTVKEPPLLANGGFEAGNFTGWVTSNLASSLYALTVRSNGFYPGFGFFSSAPSEGIYAATHGFDGSGPGSISVAQDINLPHTGSALLTFDYRAAWDMSNYPGSTLPRTFAVNIEPKGGGTPLQTFTLLTAPAGTVNFDTGPTNASLDLTAFSGQAMRISFDANVPEFYTGPGFFQLDNVVLTYSYLPPLVITSAGTNVTLMWPASATNYTLQANPSLVSSNGWTGIDTNSYSYGPTNTAVTLPVSNSAVYYRLHYP